MPAPVGQLHAEGVLPLAAQQVQVLVAQPVLAGHAPEALRNAGNQDQNSGSEFRIRFVTISRFHRQGLCFSELVHSYSTIDTQSTGRNNLQ